MPEERITIDSVLPNGYDDAKYVCELMLDETLHHSSDRFRAMAVRSGRLQAQDVAAGGTPWSI